MQPASIRRFTGSLSPRTIRAVYVLFALAVVSVCSYNFVDLMFYKVWSNDQCAWRNVGEKPDGTFEYLRITDIVPGGVADQAGLKEGDLLLKIDGQSFNNSGRAMSLINRHAAGDTARYLVERDGARFEARVRMVKTFQTTYFAVFFLGFGFLLVGALVVLMKPEGAIQRKFGRYCILSMLYFGVSEFSYTPGVDPAAKFVVLVSAVYVARVFALPAFVTFFLHFPVRGKLLDRKWFVPVLYTASVVFAIPYFRIFNIPDEMVLRRLPLIAANGFFFWGIGIFARNYFRIADRQRRTQLRPILLSMLIGVPAFMYMIVITAVDPLVIFLRPTLLLPALLIIGIPPAFGFAIIKYRVMDIQVIIRRSLLYGVVTAAIAAIYLVFVFGIGRWAGVVLGKSDDHVITVLAFIVIALLFDPIKRKAQSWIDSVFYRERLNYQKALLDFSRALPRLINLDQILTSMVDTIASTMHVDAVAVWVCDPAAGRRAIGRNIAVEDCAFDDSRDGLLALLRFTKLPQSFHLLGDEYESSPVNPLDRAALLRAGIVLVVPMFLQETITGLILAGPKKSGKPYSQEDIDLLSTVGGQAAIAIENARLHKSEIERQQMEAQLNLARRIQEGLLPKQQPDFPGLDVSGVSIPALTVGGDCYDFIPIDDTKLLVLVADVSGKGIPAALYMSKVQGMIQLAAQMHQSPRDILIQVNRRLYDSLERNSFITMILAVFDVQHREVRLCRAGHTLPLVGENSQLGYLVSDGIGMGIEKGEMFEQTLEEVRRPWKPDEYFVLYSDGLTESMNQARTEFGDRRLLDVVRGGGHDSAREMEQRIIASVDSFREGAEQHDDLTLVVVRTLGTKAGSPDV